MNMPGRTFQAVTLSGAEGYRYGFNGKETSPEISSGAVSFEARIYDSRIGRFFSTDPREGEYAWQSTYVFAHNNPIALIDYLGMGDPPPDEEVDGNNKPLTLPAKVLIEQRLEEGQTVGTGTSKRKIDAHVGSVSKFSITNENGTVDRFVGTYDAKGKFVDYRRVGKEKLEEKYDYNNYNQGGGMSFLQFMKEWNGFESINIYGSLSFKYTTIDPNNILSKIVIPFGVQGGWDSQKKWYHYPITPQSNSYYNYTQNLGIDGIIDLRHTIPKLDNSSSQSTEFGTFRALFTIPQLSRVGPMGGYKTQIDLSTDMKGTLGVGLRGNLESKITNNISVEGNLGVKAQFHKPLWTRFLSFNILPYFK